MLKNEQATYASEGIDWDYITFPENQDVLDLLDDRKDGIISILDDMCRAPSTTDRAFSTELVRRCSENSRFKTEYKDTAPFFTIHHYAGNVEYATENFIEKNRDDLPKETNFLLLGSSVPFVHKLAEIIQNGAIQSSVDNAENAGPKRARPTVGSHFLMQVRELRSKIDRTSPHYIRCIKPNASLVPSHFDQAMVASQLRCGGVLQAVGVTRNGFTLHYTYAEFIHRYSCLVPCEIMETKKRGVKPMVDFLLVKLSAHEERRKDDSSSTSDTNKDGTELLSIGKSKVLLKHHAFEALEEMLGAIQNEKATRINSSIRRFLCRMAYKNVRTCFHEELQRIGQSFDEWFKENRELYYQPRDKNLGYKPIPNIVKLRQQMIKKATAKETTSMDHKKRKQSQMHWHNSAWMLRDGLWARNPSYHRRSGKDSDTSNATAVLGTQKNETTPL